VSWAVGDGRTTAGDGNLLGGVHNGLRSMSHDGGGHEGSSGGGGELHLEDL